MLRWEYRTTLLEAVSTLSSRKHLVQEAVDVRRNIAQGNIDLPQLFLPIPARSVVAQISEHFHPQLTAYGIALQQDEL